MATADYQRPLLMAADSTYNSKGNHISGFLAKTSGAITITDGLGRVLVDAHPLTAGDHLSLPITFESGATIALSGGASGSLMV